GIRDPLVTGVQTCALPISSFQSTSDPFIQIFPVPGNDIADLQCAWTRWSGSLRIVFAVQGQLVTGTNAELGLLILSAERTAIRQIGRASCRERVEHGY